MSIKMSELNPHKYETTPEIAANLDKLLAVLQAIRAAYGKPMVITSGLRSDADQKRINPSAPKSKHLLGLACDVSDKDHALYNWLTADNNKKAIEFGVYLEHKSATINWVHLQIVPPKSGKRVFYP